MNRREFIKYIKGFGFEPVRISGSHEVFKSDRYSFNFTVKTKANIKKAYRWSFEKKLKKEKDEAL